MKLYLLISHNLLRRLVQIHVISRVTLDFDNHKVRAHKVTWLFLIEYNNQTKTAHSSHTENSNSVRSQTLMIGNSGPPGQYTIGST